MTEGISPPHLSLIERYTMQEINIAWEALKFGGAMVYPLLLLAVLAAVVILDKSFVYWRYVRLPNSLLELVETYDFSWSELDRQLTGLDQQNYFQRFFRMVMNNRGKPVWWVESRAGDEAQLIEKSLSRGLWILETIVTAAPLLGLLGTITGMMHAFNLIGSNGLVDPTGVTGGVAQALIATALGLFIAVIALFAFNFFSRRQSQMLDEMERLGTRLVDNIRMAEGFQESTDETA
jgi:biopolymer transport protein ExbB